MKTLIFLEGIENLEVLSLGFITNKTEFPALLPVLKLTKLKKIKTSLSTFSTKEFAFLEVALPNTFLCDFSNNKLKSYVITSRDYIYFLGKGTRSIYSKDEKAQDKIKLFEKKYNNYKSEAVSVIKNNCG